MKRTDGKAAGTGLEDKLSFELLVSEKLKGSWSLFPTDKQQDTCIKI